jgi:hypothetical protein
MSVLHRDIDSVYVNIDGLLVLLLVNKRYPYNPIIVARQVVAETSLNIVFSGCLFYTMIYSNCTWSSIFVAVILF